MSHLSPQTLTTDEQHALLEMTAAHPRDHLIVSPALGTGLRLSELVGLNVGDLFFPTGQPRQRLDPSVPVFCGLSRRRLSPRRTQVVFLRLARVRTYRYCLIPVSASSTSTFAGTGTTRPFWPRLSRRTGRRWRRATTARECTSPASHPPIPS
jgi:integrase